MRWLQEQLWFRGERWLGVFLALLLLLTVSVVAWRIHRWFQPIPVAEPQLTFVNAEDAPIIDAYTGHPGVQRCLAAHEAWPMSSGARARVRVRREPRVSSQVSVRITTRSEPLHRCLRTALRGFQPDATGAYDVEVDLW